MRRQIFRQASKSRRQSFRIGEDFYAAWRKSCKQAARRGLGIAAKNSLDHDHFGIRFAERKLVAADGDLHGVSERRDLTDEHFRALRDTHVHDAALDRTFACQLHNLDGFADFGVLQCFHTSVSISKASVGA